MVTVAGVHVHVQGPKDPLPVSGAAFRDDDRNSIKMILTIAAPAATEVAGGPLFVEFSLDPPYGGEYRLSGPPSSGNSWTLVPCSCDKLMVLRAWTARRLARCFALSL